MEMATDSKTSTGTSPEPQHPVWVRRLFSSIDAKDAPAFLDHLTDDARFTFGNWPAAVGRDAIGAAVDGFFASIASCAHEIQHCWTPPGHCICEGHVTYARLDGGRVRLAFVNVLAMRGDRVADYRIYIDAAPLYAPAA